MGGGGGGGREANAAATAAPASTFGRGAKATGAVRGGGKGMSSTAVGSATFFVLGRRAGLHAAAAPALASFLEFDVGAPPGRDGDLIDVAAVADDDGAVNTSRLAVAAAIQPKTKPKPDG